MLDNFFLLKEISKYLDKKLSGYIIKEIFTQEKDKLVIEFYNPQTSENKFLEYSTAEKMPYLLIKNEYKKAKKNVLNLLAGLYEQEIIGADIFNDDRIIKISLINNLSVFFIFFKSKYNLFVVADGKIIDSFKNKKDVIGNYLDDYLIKKETMQKKTYSTVKDYFRSKYRHYGDFIYREILYLLNLKGEDELTESKSGEIDNKIREINNLLEKPLYLFYSFESEFLPSLIRINHLGNCEYNKFNDVNELIQEYVKFYYGKSTDTDTRKNILAKKENVLKSYEKKLNSLVTQLEFAKNSVQFKSYGDLILSNIHLIKKGDKKLVPEGEGYPDKTEINLKETLSPSENAGMYYEKYKKQKNSVELLTEKIKKQKNEIELLKKEIDEIKNNKNLKSLRAMEKEFIKKDESDRFRKFTLGEKYEVWVGKDSASNDLLTTRYSAQNDLWFHVRGASGSHTVLKISDKKNPPDKKIIEKAASIAAYYSKARNASNVPVAYCERKYVKKKKGFKEGSVVMEKEKVIFVKPGLPEDLN